MKKSEMRELIKNLERRLSVVEDDIVILKRKHAVYRQAIDKFAGL